MNPTSFPSAAGPGGPRVAVIKDRLLPQKIHQAAGERARDQPPCCDVRLVGVEREDRRAAAESAFVASNPVTYASCDHEPAVLTMSAKYAFENERERVSAWIGTNR